MRVPVPVPKSNALAANDRSRYSSAFAIEEFTLNNMMRVRGCCKTRIHKNMNFDAK